MLIFVNVFVFTIIRGCYIFHEVCSSCLLLAWRSNLMCWRELEGSSWYSVERYLFHFCDFWSCKACQGSSSLVFALQTFGLYFEWWCILVISFRYRCSFEPILSIFHPVFGVHYAYVCSPISKEFQFTSDPWILPQIRLLVQHTKYFSQFHGNLAP